MTTEQKLVIALKSLKEIGVYQGEGSMRTPWQDIVRALGQTARDAIQQIENPVQ